MTDSGVDTMTSSHEQIATILVRDYQIPRDRLVLESALVDLGIDSLNAVELLWTIEAELGLTLPTIPVMPQRLGDVVRLIDELVAKRNIHSRAVDRHAVVSLERRAGS